jgi:hypothetical protein
MKFAKNSISYSLIFVLLIFVVFSYLRVIGQMSLDLYFSFLFAVAITTFNFILGVLSIKLSYKKSTKKFLILFLGGMAFRLLVMLIAVFICLKFLELRGNSFIFSVFFLYIFYQIIEIFYVIYQNK